MDESDMKNTGENSQLIHFLNSRATGTPIGRQNPERPSQCDAFESFGQTIVTQRRHFDDNATEGRTIPFFTDVSLKALPTLETEAMVQRGLELHDKLLYLRMKYWHLLEIDKTQWIDGVTDHRLNATLLPLLPLARFSPQIMSIVLENIEPVEKARRKLKAQSEDGVIINALWERIDDGLFGIHNGLFYIGRERERQEGVDGEQLERVIPLTTSKLADVLKWSSKTIRKIVTSLNLAPEHVPPRFRVGRYSYRGIFYDPAKMEKRLRAFVVDYPPNTLSSTLTTSVPDVPHVPHTPSGMENDIGSFLKDSPEGRRGTSGTSGTTDDVIDDLFGNKSSQCRACAFFKDGDACPRPDPRLIQPSATYVKTCPPFQSATEVT
jgi:hypothetical protein